MLIWSAARNCQQVANLLCAHANSASYPAGREKRLSTLSSSYQGCIEGGGLTGSTLTEMLEIAHKQLKDAF